jgi:hypothetical protein
VHSLNKMVIPFAAFRFRAVILWFVTTLIVMFLFDGAHAIKYAYYSQYTGAGCATYTGSEFVAFDGACGTDGEFGFRVNCTAGASTVLIYYPTADCSGPAYDPPPVVFPEGVCYSDSIRFFCLDEPTVFQVKQYDFGSNCQGPTRDISFASPTVCIE